jgi:polyribonucleotide nucleotidyltransferase
MFNISRVDLTWGGRPLRLETGKVARQAGGSVMITYGETVVLATAVAMKDAKAGQDFFPLTVHYQEKAFAAGKIPGGFFKREGRPTEKETLVSRLIDRPLRPLFPEGFFNEVQVVCTVLSHDMQNDPDVVALIGASAALCLSGVPFMGPVAAARVGVINGEYVLNPNSEQLAQSDLDLVVAGTQEGVLMVESEAKELSEEKMLGAVMFGWREFQPVIAAIIKLAEQAAKDPWDMPDLGYDKPALMAQLEKDYSEKFTKAYAIKEKTDRVTAIRAVKKTAHDALKDSGFTEQQIAMALTDLEYNIVRRNILQTKLRIDGRDGKTIRPIVAEVGILPRAHGSALFTRGETQGLVVATLGTAQDEQIMDELAGERRENFMLHYNFPPYSVGETGRMSGPGRREIGHGKLAWRAIHPLLPTKEQFPYTLRVVSEITESNGSSSMATVCGTSLALMDAGVPLPRPVAGIAMGLIKEGNDFAVLSDILGDEDHLGDMDFKVAGTANGITALQMDLKITSVNENIMQIALGQAKDGRLHILGEMAKGLSGARGEVSKNAPQVTTFKINKDKIREVIGTGGKVIREICEVSGAKVDIEDDGTIRVSAVDNAAAQKAIDMINNIAAEPEAGKIYPGKVVKIMEFGAFVNFMGAKDGLVHISELAPQRVNKVQDIVQEGQAVKVKVLGFDDRGKIKLSMKQVDQATGADLGAGNRDRGDRDQPAA